MAARRISRRAIHPAALGAEASYRAGTFFGDPGVLPRLRSTTSVINNGGQHIGTLPAFWDGLVWAGTPQRCWREHHAMTRYADDVAARVNEVFADHPELRDHRQEHPWLVGWLGDVKAPVWLVAANPSATQVDRIHSAASTPEAQWAASRGDRLFRQALVEYGLKVGEPMSAGGWNCYITNVMKSEVFVKH